MSSYKRGVFKKIAFGGQADKRGSNTPWSFNGKDKGEKKISVVRKKKIRKSCNRGGNREFSLGGPWDAKIN